MTIGILSLHVFFPNCTSLKEKRSLIKPILARMHKEFNVSIAEIGLQDTWKESLIACVMVSNEASFLHRALQEVSDFFERSWSDAELLEYHIETF